MTGIVHAVLFHTDECCVLGSSSNETQWQLETGLLDYGHLKRSLIAILKANEMPCCSIAHWFNVNFPNPSFGQTKSAIERKRKRRQNEGIRLNEQYLDSTKLAILTEVREHCGSQVKR